MHGLNISVNFRIGNKKNAKKFSLLTKIAWH